MMRFCLCVLLLCFRTAVAFCQAAADGPKFEVADVHSSPHTNQLVVRGPFTSSDRYELRWATMLDLIRIAYNVDPERVSGGPSWLEMDRFDVLAKPPSGSSTEARRQMLQALLAERLGLAIHNDSKPVPAYGLTVAKSGKLKEADASGESGCNFAVQNAPSGPPAGGGPITLPVIAYTCKNTTMAAFAAGMLSLAGAGQYFNNRLVVDQVNRKPTENSAEAMKKFPPLPMEFEVASLKPVAPDAPRGPNGPRPDVKNGRLYL